MRRHPDWGWRRKCVWIAGGLAGIAAVSSAIGDLHAAPPHDAIRRASAPARANFDRTAPSPRAATSASSVPAPSHVDILSSARQLERLNRLPEARRAYEAVLIKHPQHVECLHRLGVVCTRLNDFESARMHFDRGLLLSPEHVSMMTDAGYARYLAGDYRQSETLLRRALELSPDDPRANNNLAVLLGVTGRFDESLRQFQRVNPPVKAWTNLAYVYKLRSEPEQALICYQRARAIDPSIIIPEELLAQSQRIQPLITEADLPPSPKAPAQPAAPAARPVPSWASDASTPAAPSDGRVVVRAIVQSPSEPEPSFEPPIVVSAEDSADNPFQQPLPAASIEPAAQAAAEAAAAPESAPLQFEPPVAFSADTALDATEMAWLASERAKLLKKAHCEGTKGFCLVILNDERRLVESSEEFSVEYRSQTFHFSSPQAAERFRATPEKYMPAAGGLDVVSVRTGKAVAGGSLDHAVWYRNKLYLFTSEEHKQEFCQEPRRYSVD